MVSFSIYMETSTHLGVSNKGRTLFLQIHHISIYIYIYVQFDVYTRVLNPDMNNLRSWCIHFIEGQEKIYIRCIIGFSFWTLLIPTCFHTVISTLLFFLNINVLHLYVNHVLTNYLKFVQALYLPVISTLIKRSLVNKPGAGATVRMMKVIVKIMSIARSCLWVA